MYPHNMKAMFEKVLPSAHSSWRYWLYQLDQIPFNWHYHPEYEICLTLDSRGQRYVGDHIDHYDDLDLVLLGPKLPHTWCSNELIEPANKHRVYVAQIPTRWIESIANTMPEMTQLIGLLERSRRGILFGRETAVRCAQIFIDMENHGPMSRFIGLFQILKNMIDDPAAHTLSTNRSSYTHNHDPASEKIDRVIEYIHAHYTKPLQAGQLAQLVHMSTNHFHRFFKQRTEQTFTELVNELRIGKACSLLINSDLPIANISDACGFNNISNFNRRFLQFKHTTPSAFRKIYTSQQLSI